MIKKLSDILLKYLIKSDVIESNKESIDYYRYGLEITISSTLNIILILLVGIISHNFTESIAFLICFVPLRQYTGGYHANSYLKCNITFVSLYILLLFIYHLTSAKIDFYIELLSVLFSNIIFLTECPFEHKNKPLSDNQKHKHKILAVTLGLLYGAVGVVLKVFAYNIGVIFLYTLVLISLLVIVATLQKIREGEE